jgi:hypothetical protein
MKLSTEDYSKLALEFGLNVKLLKTVVIVEASGAGFDSRTGLIKIQFEPHWFFRFARTKIINGVENQTLEYKAYNEAYGIDKEAAMRATSWGLGQIMGFNHKRAGYNTVADMVDAFRMGEYYQVRGMLKFIAFDRVMFGALKNRNWATFAKLYNGPNFKKLGYDVKMAETYNRLN